MRDLPWDAVVYRLPCRRPSNGNRAEAPLERELTKADVETIAGIYSRVPDVRWRIWEIVDRVCKHPAERPTFEGSRPRGPFWRKKLGQESGLPRSSIRRKPRKNKAHNVNPAPQEQALVSIPTRESVWPVDEQAITIAMAETGATRGQVIAAAASYADYLTDKLHHELPSIARVRQKLADQVRRKLSFEQSKEPPPQKPDDAEPHDGPCPGVKYGLQENTVHAPFSIIDGGYRYVG